MEDEKRTASREYRAAQKEMRDVLAAKANIDHLLGATAPEHNKEQER